LEVEELHGEMLAQRQVTIQTKGHTQLVARKEGGFKEQLTELELRRRYVSFFHDLHATLQRLQKRQLLQFNATAMIRALAELLEVIAE
jgi:hypothetical protein